MDGQVDGQMDGHIKNDNRWLPYYNKNKIRIQF